MSWLREFDRSLGEVDGHTFYAAALRPSSIVFDLGAAEARFSTTLADRFGCRCYAAEALPSVYATIPRHERLVAFPVAISGTDGRLRMKVRDTHHESASFGSFEGIRDKGSIEVDSVTLEGFLGRAGVSAVDLLKVDIEGAEFAMFAAARDETLTGISQITVEFHDFLDPSLTPACEAVIHRLERLGFAAICWPQRYHGDVLFLNRRRLQLPEWRVAWFRHVVRPLRGIGRIVTRQAGRLMPQAS